MNHAEQLREKVKNCCSKKAYSCSYHCTLLFKPISLKRSTLFSSKDKNLRRFQGNIIHIITYAFTIFFLIPNFENFLFFLSLPYGTGTIFYVNLWCYLSIMLCICIWKCNTQINYFELWSLVWILQLQTLVRCIHEVLNQTWKTRTLLLKYIRDFTLFLGTMAIKNHESTCIEILLGILKILLNFEFETEK